MAIPRLITTLLVVIIAWWLAGSFLGIPFGALTLTSILFIVMVLSFAKYFRLPVWWFIKAKKMNLWIGIAALIFLAYTGGWLSGILGGTSAVITAPMTAPTAPATGALTSCQQSTSEEIRGTAATVLFDAWDKESDTPYSAAVDVANGWIYKNGNSAEDYVTNLSDTSAGALTGFSVGDVIYVYSGGTSYYTNPVEAVCVDQQRKSISLDTHSMMAATNGEITGYDSTASATLTAGPSSVTDYNLSLGAGAADIFYLKFKVNVANKAYNFAGWGIAEQNISSVKPLATEGRSYIQKPTYDFLEGIQVKLNETECGAIASWGTTVNMDYKPYVLSQPLLMHEWDSIKDKFEAKSASGADPVGSAYCSNNEGSVQIIALDAQYVRGDDGKVYLDIYDHTSSESDAGLAHSTQLASPIGKDTSVRIGFT